MFDSESVPCDFHIYFLFKLLDDIEATLQRKNNKLELELKKMKVYLKDTRNKLEETQKELRDVTKEIALEAERKKSKKKKVVVRNTTRVNAIY